MSKKTLTTQDLLDIQSTLRIVVKDELRKEIEKEIWPLKQDFSKLQSTVDKYFYQTEAWHQEQIVLAAQQNQIKKVLINKKVATEQELSLTAS